MFHHHTEYTLQKIFISPKHISSLCNILSKILQSEQIDNGLHRRKLLYRFTPYFIPPTLVLFQ